MARVRESDAERVITGGRARAAEGRTRIILGLLCSVCRTSIARVCRFRSVSTLSAKVAEEQCP